MVRGALVAMVAVQACSALVEICCDPESDLCKHAAARGLETLRIAEGSRFDHARGLLLLGTYCRRMQALTPGCRSLAPRGVHGRVSMKRSSDQPIVLAWAGGPDCR